MLSIRVEIDTYFTYREVSSRAPFNCWGCCSLELFLVLWLIVQNMSKITNPAGFIAVQGTAHCMLVIIP